MCGIFGYCQRDKNTIDPAALTRILQEIRHRGPDDEGLLFFNNLNRETISCSGNDSDPRIALTSVEQLREFPFHAFLGHRRLSILDLSPAGHQPMPSPDHRYWIIFNGEIYNYLELREELKSKGYPFSTTSDTEVLLAAYDCWGEGMLTRLIGMFALCILDVQRRELFLARDFFGIKPLYYFQDASRFAFASEINALLSLPNVNRRAHPQTVYGFLRYGISDYLPQTMFDGILQLPPAHYLRFSLDRPQQSELKEYWNLRNIHPRKNISFDDAAQELRELFLQNMLLHMRSDVPVGACLSGGIDSSSIVSAMRHLAGPKLDLRTFSYVAKETGIDEECWMDLVIHSTGARAEKVAVHPHELVHDIDRLIKVQQEPFGSTSIYAQYRVFQKAHASGIKVMQDGQGADEIFAGYTPYLSARIASLISHLSIFRAARLFRASSKTGFSRSQILRRTAGFLIPNAARRIVRKMEGEEKFIPWLNSGWFHERGVFEADPFQKQGNSFLQQDLVLALTRTSLPMLLRYEDRNSMAFSIESRVPFLSPNLVEFVFALPEEYLIDDSGLTKAVFRKAMQGIVPDRILDRRDKIGFATPEKTLLNAIHPWMRSTLDNEATRKGNPIHAKAAAQEWQAVLEGQKPFGFHIWRMFNLLKWAELFNVSF